MKIFRLVGLEQSAWARASALWSVLFCLTLATELGAETVRALFLAGVGSKALPPAFILEAVLALIATTFYYFMVRRASYGRVMAVMSVAYAVAMALLALASRVGSPSGLVAAYAVEQVAARLILLHWGVYLVDFFTVRESTTSFAFIYSSQPLGAVAAGLILVANPFADFSVLCLGALALALVSLVLLRAADRVLVHSTRLHVAPPSSVQGARTTASWRYVFDAPVVRSMAVATVFLVLTRALLQVSGATVLERRFGTAGSIGEFLGYYKIYTNVAVFGIQAVFSARLMQALSPTRLNLSYSVFTLLGFLSLFVAPGTPSLVFSQLVYGELKSLLKTPFTSLMYGAMADYARAATRMAVFGVLIPLSGLASGLLMIGLTSFGWWSGGAGVVAAGIITSLGFVAATVHQNRAYKLALVALLQEKLGVVVRPGESSIMRVPDGRNLDIRKIRDRLDYHLVRGAWARRLFPDFFKASGKDFLETRLEELLMLVELYRPKGAPHLRSLLVAALHDHRRDLLDNASEAIDSILPRKLAARGRELLAQGFFGLHPAQGEPRIVTGNPAGGSPHP